MLLHGVTGSELMWRRVVPLLAQQHEAIALTALGHRGGRNPTARPVRIADVVDDAERALDELGLDRPHLAGNSMGGWVALELARRHRARTVCALSPAGCWTTGTGDQQHATTALRRVVWLTEHTRQVLPVAARVPLVRRIALRDNVVHGNRLTPEEFVDLADDLLGCTARTDLLSSDEQLEPMHPLPCPVVLAWAARDRIFPPAVNGARARKLFPQAQYRILPDVGHVAMLDDPDLVARTILETTQLR